MARRSHVVAAVVLAFLACTAIRDDELECEEAVGRLLECCPGFQVAEGYCVYVASEGCNSPPPIYPALAPEESRCIRGASCDGLVTSGVCARAAAVRPGSDCSEDWCSRSPVCQ